MDKPVISSRLRTIHHYFSDNALAFFEPNRPASLAEQMVRVYRDAALRQQLVARAKQEYAPIRWTVMKQRYLELVNRVSGVTSGITTAVPASDPRLPQLADVK
jgi:hypothetical protein